MSIDRLIIVAGPKAVGKSFLMDRLQERALPLLGRLIELGEPNSWRYAAALEFAEESVRDRLNDSTIERLILHYEMTGPWDRGYKRGFAEHKPLEILKFAREITFVTLWAPCDILLDRFMARNPWYGNWLLWLHTMYHHGFRKSYRMLDSDFRPLYRNPTAVLRIYEQWFSFCRTHKVNTHCLVDSSNDRFFSVLVGQCDSDPITQILEWSRTPQNPM